MFQSKSADSPFSDPNLGAGALEYIEVRAKTESSDHFTSATPLVFDFNVGQGRYVLLNESYFEVKYKVGRIRHGKKIVEPLADTEDQATDGSSIADYDNSGRHDGSENQDSAGAPTANQKIDISLQPRFLNHCISNIRHHINGVQVAYQTEPPAAQTFKDTQCSTSYDEKAASAFLAQTTTTARRDQCSGSVDQTVCYTPPMGLWDVPDAITGCRHQVNIDLNSHATYNQSVWSFPLASGKTAADFSHLVNSPALAANATRAHYCFGIESIVLRLATISPRDRIMPAPSVLLECRDIHCVRVDAGSQNSITKSVTIPGSTYKQGLMFTGDLNSSETNQAQALLSDITGLTSLQWSVAGQQLQLPQYDLSDESPVRPYADYLACNASLYSDRGVGVVPNVNQWNSYPIYMARVVQEPTGAQKECLIRAQTSQNTSKVFVLGSYCMSRILMYYNESGEVANVSINL